ncbi:hypothetical protein PVT67_00295 [Gallaecimonas kandeliae]|uniref:hypothetical protein n=1 Tax=Gallaecimonas kandeliae TaxID=3029055 RepID=UPI00264958EE|nr:hypothetical protein [Gallaecimonas kandeliae]WKE65731.1 hypothetical protein PVT67_00295 [Gallaecimonas kandeliae]
MPWQLSLHGGRLGALPWPDALAGLPQPQEPATLAGWQQALLEGQTWLLLPQDERPRQAQWQAWGQVNLQFGRAGLAWVLAQLDKAKAPARLLALAPKRPAWLAIDWTPAASGLRLEHLALDGQPQGQLDLGALLEKGQAACPRPALLSCPGMGREADLGWLWPCLGKLGDWSQAQWQFAEASLGELDVVGSLYRLWQLHQDFMEGALPGKAVTLELDSSPMAALAVLGWTHEQGIA